ncbi:MAG: cytochrome c5 family protein [Burkholderiales bacterium]|nr:cytochrome c5 family protein [Burkholderiales bacterium]
MSDSHDAQGHEGPIKTPRQLIWTVVAAFVVPVAVIVLLVNFVTSAPRPGAGSDWNSAEAVARRLLPIGHLQLAGAPAAGDAVAAPAAQAAAAPTAPTAEAAPVAAAPVAAAAPAGAAPAAVAAAPAAGSEPPALYARSCTSCHRSGVAGAPKTGDHAAWAPRAATGIDALTASVIKGKGAMPPRGTAAKASDAEIREVVAYMLRSAGH